MPEINDNSSVEGVGTGALPLQNPRFFENEIALSPMALKFGKSGRIKPLETHCIPANNSDFFSAI